MSTITTDSTFGDESLLNDLLGKDTATSLTVLPTAQLSIVRPEGTTQIVGTNGDDLLRGTAASSNIFAAGGNDAILAGSGDNFIFTTDARRRGAFERDYLNVAAGKDTIFLGDENGSYYISDGWFDSVYIDGFDAAEDSLVLFGSSDLYSLEQTAEGTWLMFGDDSSTAVAYLNDVINFDLEGDAIAYVNDSVAVDSSVDNIDEEALVADAFPPILPSVLSLQPEIREYDDVGGSIGDDLLLGSATADRLLGFAGRDYALGGGSADLFVLGDADRIYYAEQGWADSVYIDDFTVGVDQLQLKGSASDYSATTNESGAWIYAAGEAIAYLNGVTAVDFSSFQYVN